MLSCSHTIRLFCHAIALFIEAVGTLFIFLDTKRLNARFPSEPGVIGTVGDPLGYRVWYYHCAELGFTLLFLGILIAAFVLWLEHLSFVKNHKQKSDSKESI
jgi:Na+-transporting methylmalonyl-CoA/oxaloacetate decarboxylase gamma subunit